MANKVPTQAQIDAEIKWLNDNKDRVRPMTGFGESNHEAIDAQIATLTNHWDGNEVWERWSPENVDSETGEPAEDANERLYDMALEVVNWMEGTIKRKPSEGWKSLVKK